jgi:hypothetical protein
MRLHALFVPTLLGLSVVSCAAQSKANSELSDLPSNDEVRELLNKAEEKVSGFEKAMKQVKPDLGPEESAKDLNAASAARTIIQAIQKNGTTGYGLVSLLATLDDLGLDASAAAVLLLAKGKCRPEDMGSMLLLMKSKNELSDISELIMHATLRFIHIEEEILRKLMDAAKN